MQDLKEAGVQTRHLSESEPLGRQPWEGELLKGSLEAGDYEGEVAQDPMLPAPDRHSLAESMILVHTESHQVLIENIKCG